LAFQKALPKTRRQPTRRVRRQDAEQSAPGGDPGKRLLENSHAQVVAEQVANSQRRERAI
jgi:hypothetical protein